jgi:hypothetical protein
VLAERGQQTECFVDGRPVITDRRDGGRSHAARSSDVEDRVSNQFGHAVTFT